MIDLVDKAFAVLLSQLLKNCRDQNVVMIPYEKLRTPQIQAQFWIQGRTLKDTQTEIKNLKEEGAFFLASCLENAEMKEGKIVTNALPGFSWHQWGEAVDCYWLRDGSTDWDLNTKDENGQNGYEIYAGEARKLGLESGFYWKGLIDAVHVQLQPFSSPREIYSIFEINEVMRKFYS